MTTQTDASPLAAIERRVQERAAGLALRMDGPDAAERLRALVAEEVAEWDLEHKRGRRPVALGDPATVAERALRNLVGHGPLQELLEDEATRRIPIIFLTARADVRDRARGLGAGGLDYITKPFNPVELATLVRSVLVAVERGERERLRSDKVAQLRELFEGV